MAVPNMTRGTQNDYPNSKKLSNLHFSFICSFYSLCKSIFPHIKEIYKESSHTERAHIEILVISSKYSTVVI